MYINNIKRGLFFSINEEIANSREQLLDPSTMSLEERRLVGIESVVGDTLKYLICWNEEWNVKIAHDILSIAQQKLNLPNGHLQFNFPSAYVCMLNINIISSFSPNWFILPTLFISLAAMGGTSVENVAQGSIRGFPMRFLPLLIVAAVVVFAGLVFGIFCYYIRRRNRTKEGTSGLQVSRWIPWW